MESEGGEMVDGDEDEDEDSSRCTGSLRRLDSDIAAVLVPSPAIKKKKS